MKAGQRLLIKVDLQAMRTSFNKRTKSLQEIITDTKEHLRKVVALHQRNWDARLPMFLLTYRASTHDTTSLAAASLELGRELHLPYDLLFGASPDKERPTIGHASKLVDHLHDTHNYARQHLKLASERMKTLYDRLAN
jgi:predicted small metal-binding protein